jgi:hypothetical protein
MVTTDLSELFKAIKSGSLTVERPDLIPIRRLEKYIRYCDCLDRMSAAIAYSICYNHRVGEEWTIYYAVGHKRIKNIALYVKGNSISSFDSIKAIDYSILLSDCSGKFLDKYPMIRSSIVWQLSRIKNGQ